MSLDGGPKCDPQAVIFIDHAACAISKGQKTLVDVLRSSETILWRENCVLENDFFHYLKRSKQACLLLTLPGFTYLEKLYKAQFMQRALHHLVTEFPSCENFEPFLAVLVAEGANILGWSPAQARAMDAAWFNIFSSKLCTEQTAVQAASYYTSLDSSNSRPCSTAVYSPESEQVAKRVVSRAAFVDTNDIYDAAELKHVLDKYCTDDRCKQPIWMHSRLAYPACMDCVDTSDLSGSNKGLAEYVARRRDAGRRDAGRQCEHYHFSQIDSMCMLPLVLRLYRSSGNLDDRRVTAIFEESQSSLPWLHSLEQLPIVNRRLHDGPTCDHERLSEEQRQVSILKCTSTGSVARSLKSLCRDTVLLQLDMDNIIDAVQALPLPPAVRIYLLSNC